MSDAPSTSPAAVKELLREEARKLGFEAFGVTSALPAERAAYLKEWLAEGRHAGMAWLERDVERRMDPRLVLPGAKSVVCVGLNYYQPQPEGRAKVATYALGGDYHKLMDHRLKKLCEILRAHGGANRPYADTGPVLEKLLCERAGLGWQGRHTGLVHPILGGWLILGVVLTTLELPVDAPSPNRCGSCSRCLQTCPTGALTASGQLDARRCLSYLTIENRGPIPVEFREAVGNRLHGCDECVGACPWNRRHAVTAEERFKPRPLPDPATILAWSPEDFEKAVAGSAVKRAGYDGIRRNACVVLGNVGTAADLPALRAAASCGSALVEEHAVWAIGRIEGRAAAGGVIS